jgi:hypothetical protein
VTLLKILEFQIELILNRTVYTYGNESLKFGNFHAFSVGSLCYFVIFTVL